MKSSNVSIYFFIMYSYDRLAVVVYYDDKLGKISPFNGDFFKVVQWSSRDHSSQGLMSVSMATQLYAAYRSFSSQTFALQDRMEKRRKDMVLCYITKQ